MGRKRKNDQTLSLFAFQDIITGVAGVMLFILLLLVVQLAIKTAEATTTPPTVEPEPSPTETIELATPQAIAKLEALRQKTSELRRKNASLFGSDVETLNEDLVKLKQKIRQRELEAEELRKQTEKIKQTKDEIASSPETKKTFESIASLREQIKELDEKIETLDEGTQVSFTIAGKVREDAWMVDMDRDVIRVFAAKGSIKGAEIKRGFFSTPSAAAREISARIKSLTNSKTLVVLVRPSDPEGSYETIIHLREMRYNVAMELLGAGVDVVPLMQ